MGCGLLLAPDASAIFVIGAFDSFDVLRIRSYPINDFDLDNNGEIGEDEGIPVEIEVGKSGFTEDELTLIRESFATWEEVPQSYGSFYEAGTFQDPIIAGSDATFDLQNSIVMQVDTAGTDDSIEPDPPTVLQPVLPGVLGYNIAAWAGEDFLIETPEGSYQISSGQIIDNDVLIYADMVRPQELGGTPPGDFKSVMVHELGHFLGLAHTPLSNLTVTDGGIVESAVMTHSVAGVKRRIGVTPTMFPAIFDLATEGGVQGGGADLAPDDISAISWLYPRGSQDLFFGLKGEARTRTRVGGGVPSIAVPLAHIVAWGDLDNDETTPRVAVFSAFTAYFENPLNVERDGRFELINLWRQMETDSGLFNATYTFTMTPMNGGGFDRQAPPIDASSFDSIGNRGEVFNTYTSEVFHEVEPIVDVSNKDAGTPFVWDYELGTLVSTDTGRTIESIVGDDPMFGDPNDVCILNVVSSAAAGGGTATLNGAVRGANSVRSLRDSVLLETALGSLIVDSYYKVSPTAAKFLLGNSLAYGATVKVVQMAYWCIENIVMVLGALTVVIGLGVALLKKRRSVAAGAAGAVLLAFIAMSGAEALILYQTTEQLVAGSTDIVSGTVKSANPRWSGGTAYVYTDIVIEIEDKAKGTLNKQSNLTISQIGGRVGGLVSENSELPKFQAGEEVLLYLTKNDDGEFVIYNGLAGKLVVGFDAAKQTKYVAIPDDLKAKKAAKLAPGETVPETMPLSDFLAELRAIAKAQEKAKS